MGKYQKYSTRAHQAERPWKIHPVWRGIGCLVMILIPILAFAGAIMFVQLNSQQGWLPMPPEVTRTVAVPFFGNVANLYAYVGVAIILMVLGFGVLVVLYSLLYSLVGPPKYGPYDSPPIRRQSRRRR